MGDPSDTYTVDALRLALGRPVVAQVGVISEIEAAIERQYGEGPASLSEIGEDAGGEKDRDLEDVQQLRELASEAPVIRMVNLMVARALETGASDIHVEPYPGRLSVRYRIDGLLRDVDAPPARSTAAIISRIKVMAKPQHGEVLEGEIDAASQEQVVGRLQAQGHVPILAEEVVAGSPRAFRFAPMAPRRSEGRCRRLHFRTRRAAEIRTGSRQARKVVPQRRFGEVVADLQSQVRRGTDLSAAMERHPRIFSRMYRNMVRAGEVSGSLDASLERVADFQERVRSLRETLVSALIYPVLLLVFAGISISVILGVVIPRVSALFTDAGQELPMATQVGGAGR